MEVAPGVHRLGSHYVNYYVITDGDAVTVIDAGLPRQWGQLVAALERLGRSPRQIEALVLTHAHADHLGFNARARDVGASIRVHPADAEPGLRRFPPLHLYLLPTSWPFMVQALWGGLVATPDLRAPVTFGDGDKLDVPGRPTVWHTPGHTRGHCAVHLEDRGVLFTGDALVTFDPYTRQRGPRLLIGGVNEDLDACRSSLDRIAGMDAEVLLPGHGEPWRGTAQAAVAKTRTSA